MIDGDRPQRSEQRQKRRKFGGLEPLVARPFLAKEVSGVLEVHCCCFCAESIALLSAELNPRMVLP